MARPDDVSTLVETAVAVPARRMNSRNVLANSRMQSRRLLAVPEARGPDEVPRATRPVLDQLASHLEKPL